MRRRQLWAWAILAATVVFALAPLYREGEVSVPLHHLLHVVMLVGAAVSALLLVSPVALSRGRALWLILSIVSPLLAMFLMWPSDYSVFERSPMLHVAQHLGLVVFGFLTGYAGQRYAAGIGVVMSLSLGLMGLLAIGGYGVSPPLQVGLISQVPAAAPLSASPQVASAPNAMHGATLFQQNCSACHGAHGQGGVGPSLIGESSRKNFRQAVRWIENPASPMPKLYPGTLSGQDVRDVAAYVESLK